MTSSGDEHGTRPGPERTCVGCRIRRRADELVRCVLADGAVAVDPVGVLPGRGAWLCPQRDCVEKAIRRNAFSRAFRIAVLNPERGSFWSALEEAGRRRRA